MGGKLVKILIAVFAVCLITPAFTAVENVKVGGDIQVYGVLRSDFDLSGSSPEDLHLFQTSARVYVTADLSENITANIRLINERDWGTEVLGPFGTREIDLDLANIQVKDLLAPGLNLTVGRQEIQFGEGLVVGSQYNAYAYPAVIGAPDLGLQKAFDAIKVDYSATAVPLNLTAFLSKIGEGFVGDDVDVNLYGINLGFKAADIANIDVYYVRADDQPSNSTLDTAGVRVVSGVPALTGLTLKGEYAQQFGDDGTSDYEGRALLLGVEYAFQTNMSPVLKVNYTLLSGDDTPGGDIEDWQMVAPSNIGSRIGPLFYAYDAYNTIIGRESNLSVINLGVSFKPVEKVKIGIDGYMANLDEGTLDDVGNEIDLTIEYQHTEDLSFGFCLGEIFADDVIEAAGGDDAWQALLTMKVSF